MEEQSKTVHTVHYSDARTMSTISDESVELVVTSPPYPMIQMWDTIFSLQNKKIQDALDEENGVLAFELMNKELDKVWKESYRVLKPGGFACINIGDATRTMNGSFQLYPNHSRIINYCRSLGFQSLPTILWKKQTNAPNKFMGSGMLPPGAYVTLEHEYILILRKGGKKEFKAEEEKMKRRESAFFWEERNQWFSDIWFDLKGTRQQLNDPKTRARSGAYPFELAYRIINMFSTKGDTILDPFLGTGTTTLAAIASERNSVGIEIDSAFKKSVYTSIQNSLPFINQYLKKRIEQHSEFIEERETEKSKLKFFNMYHGFRVMSSQETELKIKMAHSLLSKDAVCIVRYADTEPIISDHETISISSIERQKKLIVQ